MALNRCLIYSSKSILKKNFKILNCYLIKSNYSSFNELNKKDKINQQLNKENKFKKLNLNQQQDQLNLKQQQKGKLNLKQQQDQLNQQLKQNQNKLNKEMSSSETEQELTNEQLDNLFKQKLSHLILRKYENDNKIFIKLKYKFKINEDNRLKIKDHLFSFQRPIDEQLKLFIDKLRLNVSKFILIKKTKRKGKKQIDLIDDNINNQNLLDIKLIYENRDLINTNIQLVELFKLKKDNLKLLINNLEYQIYFNPQFISSCKLPKIILCNFEIFPLIQIDFNDNLNQLEYGWFKKIDKKNENYLQLKRDGLIKNGLFKLSDQLTYTPTKLDLNNELIFRIKSKLDNNLELENYEVITKKVKDTPDYYPYEQRHEFTKLKTQSNEFRIVSYNILADVYSDSKTARDHLFKYCPAEYLTMDYRKHLIFKELLGYNADIICLQECDQHVFDKHLKLGFQLKTTLNGEIALKDKMQEGCSIFYNNSKFNLIEQLSTKISEFINKPSFNYLKELIDNNFQLKSRFQVRPNILQMLALELKDNQDKLLLVFNTHFYFHPDSDHIRLLHACLMIKEIEDQINRFNKLYKQVIPIIAGDFNSCPEFGVYKLFTEGHVDRDLIDWKSCHGEHIKEFDFTSDLRFKSAYGVPEYTNYTDQFSGCLDYIFYNEDQLKCKDIVPLIPHEEVIRNIAIPSLNIPSDHLALACTFKF